MMPSLQSSSPLRACGGLPIRMMCLLYAPLHRAEPDQRPPPTEFLKTNCTSMLANEVSLAHTAAVIHNWAFFVTVVAVSQPHLKLGYGGEEA